MMNDITGSTDNPVIVSSCPKSAISYAPRWAGRCHVPMQSR